MARRVAAAALLALCVVRPGSAFGDILARAGIAQAMLGHWQPALEFFEAEADTDRATRYFAAKALLELAVQGDALSALRELSDSEGAFAGPALELPHNLLQDPAHIQDICFEGQAF